jgi:formate hydrogenlyase subunit 3/multisubunit Na+/H+ antiporter MnhD subunit
MGISLATLAGVPPSPLFVSELLIVAGGFEAGWDWAAASATVLLALGFVGLTHALIETTVGSAHRRNKGPIAGLSSLTPLTASATALLLALTAAAPLLIGSDTVTALTQTIP